MLSVSFGEEASIFGGFCPGFDHSSFDDGLFVSLALEAARGDQALDLGRLGGGLLAFFLGGDLTSDDVLSDVIFFGQVKEFADFGSSLRAKSSGNNSVSQTLDFLLSLSQNNQIDDRQVRSNDTASNGLPLAFTISSRTVAFGIFVEQESNSSICENSLHHGETLFVVSTSDFEDISFVFFTKALSFDFLGHTFVIKTT